MKLAELILELLCLILLSQVKVRLGTHAIATGALGALLRLWPLSLRTHYLFIAQP